MPLRGEGHSDLVRDEAPCFKSLDELDTWLAKPHNKLSGVLPYQPRPNFNFDGQPDSRGRLLVCHDYKGGYSESPSGLCYTFNFWRLCDTFVYFSHYRVTVPPSGWINTAHKQGTRILGTLIFEHDTDCLQLIVGHTDHIVRDKQIPISDRYAVLLAELAHQRGFDGYLLNFESNLVYETDQAHALAGWILLLKAELRIKVGPHAQVVWYDSVIYNGQVSYQNRLNGKNLPFFLASDALFTNYWWKPHTQDSMTDYFTKLKRADSHTLTDVALSAATKTLQNIYSGVDVWPGRGQYGDSGWCCYRAIIYTSPKGFSTALFAPGWTWESATKEAETEWDKWWDNERRLWLGPLEPGELIEVPDSPEGPFKPMNEFFQDLPLPNPSRLAFYTQFSPGVGYSWFVEGRKVLDTDRGWSDVDKQNSIGNLVWPWPIPSWHDVKNEVVLTGSTSLDMTDGFNGGNTLKLTITYAESKSENAAKSIWLPVQSLTVTTRESFEASVVYKTTGSSDVDLSSYIYVKPLSQEGGNSAAFTVGQASTTNLPRGWTRQAIRFTSRSTQETASVAIGFTIDITPQPDPPAKVTFSLSLGQLAVYPAPPPPHVSVGTPSITGAKFAPTTHALEGILTWNTASTFTPIDVGDIDGESIIPAWLLHDTRAYRFPAFVYFNVYAAPLGSDSVDPDPARIEFIGTTGLDGRANRFYVEPACLPRNFGEQSGVRFYIQGVTDRGEVLPSVRCTTVDHHITI